MNHHFESPLHISYRYSGLSDLEDDLQVTEEYGPSACIFCGIRYDTCTAAQLSKEECQKYPDRLKKGSTQQ